MSGTPFRTKFTLGLLTIEPCPQPQDKITDVEHKSAEVLAIEQAARDAIKAKKKAKKKARKRSTSPTVATRDEELMMAKQRKAEEEARQRAELERLEAERRQAEEEEAARIKAEEEEAARRKAEEEEEERRRLAEEQVKAEYEAERIQEEEAPQVKRPVAKRRISFFPCTADNEGLIDAVRRYNNDVPFDWERPEWTMDFGNLRHTTTLYRSYGWEKPDWATNYRLRQATIQKGRVEFEKPLWARRSVLRRTVLGDLIKDSASIERPISENSVSSMGDGSHSTVDRRWSMVRRHSFTDRALGAQPEWMKVNFLRQTEFGAAVRQGASLALPITEIKTLADQENNLSFLGGSFASIDCSQKHLAWEKPSWTKDCGLKSTEAGAAVRQGGNLALPVTEIRSLVGNEQPDLGGSCATLNSSIKNITWEKPAWASNPGLRKTSKGEKMKEHGTLAKPITFPKGQDV